MTEFRIEKDSLGEVRVPVEAWYGAQTARAVANFPISGRRPDKDFVLAHVRIKLAAARANCQPGWLPAEKRDAIAAACEKILAGEFDDQFVVDRFQAGAGTSHNMNSNEVIANLANVALGGEKGAYKPVNPNDDVNMGQSTNDTIPTAIRLTVLAKLPRLTAAVHAMAAEFTRLAEREKDTVKSGRTHLQDAVPTTLGQEFAGYAWTLTRYAASLEAVRPALCEIGLGGSAAGTGLNTSPDYPARVAAELAKLTNEPIQVGQLVAQMQSMNDLARLSGEIRNLALELTRISNDLRLLASGPRTGLGEIQLPPVQPGQWRARDHLGDGAGRAAAADPGAIPGLGREAGGRRDRPRGSGRMVHGARDAGRALRRRRPSGRRARDRGRRDARGRAAGHVPAVAPRRPRQPGRRAARGLNGAAQPPPGRNGWPLSSRLKRRRWRRQQ